MILATIPSPTQAVWHLGPIPVRLYAICIIAGILVAVWLTERRWVQRGGEPGAVMDIAIWAVPFGIIGGRLYHVVTSWQPYFGPNGNPLHALYIWEGGMGVWGAIALGALGAWIGARRAGVRLPPMADAAAPGIALAQGIGRLGNWFNNEVYGRPTCPGRCRSTSGTSPRAAPSSARTECPSCWEPSTPPSSTRCCGTSGWPRW